MSDSFHLSFGTANKRKVEESHKCSSLGIPNLMVGGWYPYVSEAFRHIQTNNLNSGDLWVRRWGSNFLFWQCLKPCTCCYNWSKFKTWATLENKSPVWKLNLLIPFMTWANELFSNEDNARLVGLVIVHPTQYQENCWGSSEGWIGLLTVYWTEHPKKQKKTTF